VASCAGAHALGKKRQETVFKPASKVLRKHSVSGKRRAQQTLLSSKTVAAQSICRTCCLKQQAYASNRHNKLQPNALAAATMVLSSLSAGSTAGACTESRYAQDLKYPSRSKQAELPQRHKRLSLKHESHLIHERALCVRFCHAGSLSQATSHAVHQPACMASSVKLMLQQLIVLRIDTRRALGISLAGNACPRLCPRQTCCHTIALSKPYSKT
jgi:hypothetical protein